MPNLFISGNIHFIHNGNFFILDGWMSLEDLEFAISNLISGIVTPSTVCEMLLDLLDNLDDVFVVQLMVLADLLRLVLHRGAPHQRVLHLLNDRTMNLVTEILNLNKMKGIVISL
jgi:hypothetical protein